MPTPIVPARRLALGLAVVLCLAVASRVTAKPPDLPQPTHPDLTPDERPMTERGAEAGNTFFVPSPLFLDLSEMEEQEASTPAPAGCWNPLSFLMRTVALKLWVTPYKGELDFAGDEEEAEPLPTAPTKLKILPAAPGATQPQGGAEPQGHEMHCPAGGCPQGGCCTFPQEISKSAPPASPVQSNTNAVRCLPAGAPCQGKVVCPDVTPCKAELSVPTLPVTPAQCTLTPVKISAAAPAIDPDEVLKNLDKVEKAGTLYGEAECLNESGEIDRACAIYELVVKLVPGHRFASMAHDRLRNLASLRTAGAEECEKPVAKKLPMVQATYVVTEFVAAGQSRPEQLIRLIQTTIDPESWSCNGGAGTIDYFPQGMTIVVAQTPAVQARVKALLEGVRMLRQTRKERAPAKAGQILPLGSNIVRTVHMKAEALPAQAPKVIANYDVSDVLEVKTGPGLVKMIRRTVKPGTWTGAIEFNPKTKCLVIRHDEETQGEVIAVIEKLRAVRTARAKKVEGGEEASTAPVVRETEGANVVLVTMGYDVRDLMTEHEVEWDRSTDRLRVSAKYRPDTLSSELIGLIERGIAPKSWASQGGPGRVDFNPALSTLFITQAPEAHQEIMELIEALRSEMKLRKENCEKEVRTRTGVRGAKMTSPAVPVATGKTRLSCIEEGCVRLLQNVRGRNEARVNTLLEECREALTAGRQEEAERKLHEAYALDATLVASHPLIYKMQLQDQVMAKSTPIIHRIPGIDPNVVHAYNEILQNVPSRIAVIVHEASKPATRPAGTEAPKVVEVPGEECELEFVPDDGAPGVCLDANKGRVRFQAQVGPLTLKVIRDEKSGKGSITFGLKVVGN